MPGSRSPSPRRPRSRPSGMTPRASRSARSCSAGGAGRWSRSCTRRPTGSTACSSARRCPPRRPPRRPARSDSCGSTAPACGYNMADYFAHWLEIGRREGAQLPKIFYVNWFRRDEDGKFLWPGFGENSRVLAWIFRRCGGAGEAVQTPIGLLPPIGEGGIETEGLDITEEQMAKLLEVDVELWREQLPQMHEHYARFGERLPAELRAQMQALEQRLNA